MAMNTLVNGDTLNGTLPISKQGNTVVTFNTAEKYVEKNIELTIAVPAGSAATPATSITAAPSLTLDSATGVVTGTVSASSNITPTVGEGYITSGTAGTVSVSGSDTLQLTTQAAQTITPGTTNQTIAAGKYLTGAQTIRGDANLVAANIADGVTIFGVTGTHTGGIDTSDATATAADILSGKSAYVNGVKINGSIQTKTTTDVTVSNQYVTIPAGYYASQVEKEVTSAIITTPASGTKQFSITVPNGESDPVTFVFTVDASGNTTVMPN